MTDRMLDKIAKLLNKAEHTNEAEAAALIAHAQRLATTEAIDLAVARQYIAKKEKREQPVQKSVKIGERGKKNLKLYVELFLAIANKNDVKTNIAHDSTYVYLFGMPSDIEVVEALYGSLLHQMVESANAYLKKGDYRQETVGKYVRKRVRDEWSGDYYYDEVWVEKPLDGREARASFYSGFTSRIGMRLWEARQEALEAVKDKTYVVVVNEETGEEQRAEEVVREENVSAALVLKKKAEEVSDFYHKHSTAKGSWSGASNGSASYASRSAGHTAGSSARLGSSKAIGGSRTAIS